MELRFSRIRGLTDEDAAKVKRLAEIYNAHQAANVRKRRYYEGHITVNEVNLGLALPKGIRNLEIGCAWGEKAVDVLAARSMFDGFVGTGGEDADEMARISRANNLEAEYMKACKDELKYGCSFATLSADEKIGCKIRFHTPETAAAEWDGEKNRIAYGIAIIDTERDANGNSWAPSVVNLYTDTAIVVMRLSDKNGGVWDATYLPSKMGRPLMEPFAWNATSDKPFGRSRLKNSIRRLIQGYVRTIANATIGLEFSTAPQKYLLGITDDQYDALIDQKFRTYVGNMLMATTNPESGEKPSFGQLSQGTIEPHVQMMRLLATQFSAATGLTVTDVGVVNDANPTSSDAILAQSQTLVTLAEQLNTGNANALYNVAMMAQAISANCTIEELDESKRNIVAHFKNPAMPSVAVTADAAIKLATARPGFASTDVFLEMVGFDQAEIRRIKGQESKARGLAVLTEEITDETFGE